MSAGLLLEVSRSLLALLTLGHQLPPFLRQRLRTKVGVGPVDIRDTLVGEPAGRFFADVVAGGERIHEVADYFRVLAVALNHAGKKPGERVLLEFVEALHTVRDLRGGFLPLGLYGGSHWWLPYGHAPRTTPLSTVQSCVVIKMTPSCVGATSVKRFIATFGIRPYKRSKQTCWRQPRAVTFLWKQVCTSNIKDASTISIAWIEINKALLLHHLSMR